MFDTAIGGFSCLQRVTLSVHGRSVTEIWGRDEMKHMDLWGGDETKNLDLLGDENSNLALHTQKSKR